MARADGPTAEKRASGGELPEGVRLYSVLGGYASSLSSLAWSPDGNLLAASAYQYPGIDLWDWMANTKGGIHLETAGGALAWSSDGALLAAVPVDALQGQGIVWQQPDNRLFTLPFDDYRCVAWSPTEARFATGVGPGVYVWRLRQHIGDLHPERPTPMARIDPCAIAWSPHGRYLAVAGRAPGLIWIVSTESPDSPAAPTYVLQGHSTFVSGVAWSADGRLVVSASHDRTLRVWHFKTGKTIWVLEGHQRKLLGVTMSPDGRLLASHAQNEAIRLWRTDTWQPVATIPTGATGDGWDTALAFHPKLPLLAGIAPTNRIGLYELDYDVLLKSASRAPGSVTSYRNAKVVLVGDSGVGKSGIGLVLSGKPYETTDSTHGRKVFHLGRSEVQEQSTIEERETLLWDLAGQPGYRVIHRQHLDEVAVGVVVFDARSETEPFAGVGYWARALDEATRGFPLVKLLVAARVDRGGPAVSRARIDEALARYGFAAFFETSARRGDGMDALSRAITGAIAWDRLPRVTAPELFASIKRFLVGEKEAGRVLAARDELYARYRDAHPGLAAAGDAFDTCAGRLEAAGLVKRLPFGDFVLLQPELLDDYSAWLAHAARAEPGGLGFILERRARAGDFPMDADRPLAGKPDESRLLIATVEDILGRGIALRQATQGGEMLVFPSELREDLPDYPGGYVQALELRFEGPVKAVYATVVVCLAHTPAFDTHRFYRNAALFRSRTGEICGVAVDYPDRGDDARGRLVAFFDEATSRETKLTFLAFVEHQVLAMAFADSVTARQIHQCPCGYLIPTDAIERRRARGEKTAICPDCGRHPPIDDLLRDSKKKSAEVREQVEHAQEEQRRQARLSILDERERRAEFHVLICHNAKDKPEVRRLAAKLRDQGILPWLDEQSLPPGAQAVPALEQVIEKAGAAAVIVGPSAVGPWQEQEYYALVQRVVDDVKDGRRRSMPLIPVLLPGAPDLRRLPAFLRTFMAADFRDAGLDDRDVLVRLVHGILRDDT